MVKRYVVIGPRRVCEHDPGDDFEHDFTEAEEKRLLGVHLRLVKPKPEPDLVADAAVGSDVDESDPIELTSGGEAPTPVEPPLPAVAVPPAPARKPAPRRRVNPQPKSEE
jgi:hypothetical protein